MKALKTKIGNCEYFLIYNAEAFFSLQDVLGETNIFEALEAPGRVGYDNLVKVAATLAEEGELTRRYYGYDKNEIPTEDFIRYSTGVLELPALRRDVQYSIFLGLEQKIDDPDKEIDLVLQEIEKKKP